MQLDTALSERDNLIAASYALALDAWVVDPAQAPSIEAQAIAINRMPNGPEKTKSLREWADRYHMARLSMPQCSPESFALAARLFNNALSKAQAQKLRLDESPVTPEIVSNVVSLS